MCGFAAVFEKGAVFPDSLLRAFGHDLYHRGPDSGGVFKAPGCALVFRRLAIIDPQAQSNQPMQDQSGRYALVFNGEIYNYQDLRLQLQAQGIRLRTNGDTETIVEGFAKWGPDIFQKLEGMFACVLYDRLEQKVYAARDPYGIKPLYMTHNQGQIGFASETRPLRRWIKKSEPDDAAISELLMFRFAGGNFSNYQDIELVRGGSLISMDLGSGTLGRRTFCDPLDTFQPNHNMTAEQAEELVTNALDASVRTHMQSDVGYALQLSGGVDSSLVLAMTASQTEHSLDSFAVKLTDDAYDEGPYREQVLDRYKTNHNELTLSAEDFADALPQAIAHMEGPVPHFGCVMLMLLCQEIAKSHKVVLTGEGADEFFGGYERYALWPHLNKFNRVAKWVPQFAWPFLKRYEYLQRFANQDAAVVSSVYFDFLKLNGLFPDLFPRSQGQREATANRFSDFRSRMNAVDQTYYLGSLLMRQDKMAMSASVEARVPLTHYPLAKVINTIPMHLRMPGHITKPLLKKFAEQWLPHDVIYRRKVGLNLPLETWLRDENSLGRYLPLLTDGQSRLAQYAAPKTLRNMVTNFLDGKPQPGMPPLAHLVNMELWLRSTSDINLPHTAPLQPQGSAAN